MAILKLLDFLDLFNSNQLYFFVVEWNWARKNFASIFYTQMEHWNFIYVIFFLLHRNCFFFLYFEEWKTKWGRREMNWFIFMRFFFLKSLTLFASESKRYCTHRYSAFCGKDEEHLSTENRIIVKIFIFICRSSL